MSAIKYMSALAVFSAFAAYLLQAIIALRHLNKVTSVLTLLLSLENTNKISSVRKIAIGYGACTDLLVNGVQFLNYTDTVAHNWDAGGNTEEIQNLEQLQQSFGYFFKNGAAAERFMPDNELFKHLITHAKTHHRENIQWFLGGNAALMGQRFYMEGAEVLLGAQMSKKLRRLLPNEVKITGDPLDEDEIHLILEYKSGEKWGDLISPRANRFIVHSDHNNPKLHVAEQFGTELTNFNPDLFVVTGLHVMDKFKLEPGMREARLSSIKSQLLSHSYKKAHFEMASYVDLQLLLLISEYVFPYVDSIGMNEQELSNLYEVLKNGKTTTASTWNPDIAETLDQTRSIYRRILGSAKNHKTLSRIHVHTLAYQVILTKKDSEWQSGKAAAAKASLTAHRYVCQTNTINPESATLLLTDKFYTSKTKRIKELKTFDTQNVVSCWDEDIENIKLHKPEKVEICVAPVLVCRIAKKAAGAGDNISAAALYQQL